MSNYQTSVHAMPTRIPDDQSLPQPLVIISCDVQLYHIESAVQGGTEFPPRILQHRAFSYRAEHPSAPFESPDHLPSSPSWAIVSSMLDDMRLPFLLDRLRWLDLSVGTNASKKCLTRDELASEIARVACCAVNNNRNEGRKRTKIVVSMMHRVMISELEFHEMQAQLRRLDLQFLHSRMLEEEDRGRQFPILEQRFLLNLMRQEGLVANSDHDREDVLRRRVSRQSLNQEVAIDFEAARESIVQKPGQSGVRGGKKRSSSYELNGKRAC